MTQRLAASAPTSVDLSTYVRIGRFDLPEPTRTTAPADSLLAQEASGVTYDWDTDTLFVVGDGGTSVVQVGKDGHLIDSMTLAPGASPQGTDFYDTEGITYVGGGKFVLVEERYRQANLFTYVGGGTLHRADAVAVKLGTTIGNVGLEGVSYDPMTTGVTGGFIFVKEKDPQSIFQTNINFAAGTATNGSPTATSSTDLFSPALANLADFSDVFALSNLPSLSGHADFSHLLVISQESGQIVNIDRSGNVSSRLTIVADPGNPLTVPDMTMEGVTMDRDGNLYVVNESGGGDGNHPQLWVYAHSDAPDLPPTAVSLNNTVTSIPENASTAAPIKVAGIVITDDGLGVNNLTVTGADASFFQIVGTGLFLKAGTALNSLTKPSYNVTVNVDDPIVGSTPDASTSFTLAVTASTGGAASLIISEVAPWSSGNGTLGADWFEVTNVGTAAQSLAGWTMDDDSSAPNIAPLVGISTIAPGESVIFIELGSGHTAAGDAAKFRALWGVPATVKIGSYAGSGVGLGTGGDQVNLFDGIAKRAGVTFGGATTASPFKTFDNSAGLNWNGTTNATITTLSATGVNGAFSIADALSTTNSTVVTAVASPGTIGAPPTPVVTIAATDANAAETGPDPGTFRITRTGSTVGVLTVNYSIAAGTGQASALDYTPALTGVATIAFGQSFVDVVITPEDDSIFEGPETVTLTLSDSGSYDVGAASTATITIADDDPPDTTIDSSPVSLTTSTSAHFAFSASQPASAIARLECSLDGVAFDTCTSAVDYTGLADGSHTFLVRAIGNATHADPTPASFTWTVDATPPTITGSRTPAPNAAGWNNAPVVVTFECADAVSGLAMGSPPAPVTFAAEGVNLSVSRSCTDVAGNSASASVQGINIDLTPPAITIAASVPVLWPANGKLVPDTISGAVTDSLSGIDLSTVAFAVVDEYGQLQPAGAVSVGPDGRFSFLVKLEARRLGQDSDGRFYQIVISARDKAGNQTSASTVVTVPHDQGK